MESVPADLQWWFDDRYEKCLHRVGFDPGGVEVILDMGGTPLAVRTGREVPALFHGRCMEDIGGTDNGLSSWGR